ncbi:hypothetical protein N7495_007223 [Penicillium taxi]|uniref:uncharacterized protein n=1 Tax=Penicillium taxi TaxID=168475 RepID=UPI002544EDD7|nr:uncharacterized protein N7495_007223 [Penicillium taxi]KAJ5895532.1 hypothetical protein N7495_007223 [Penicillium taxi]
MKTSISSDVWEKKKALIAKLYMEEEWPLKQVIKQIRSDNFNPSETQLRSRLKKWRVTKPSRQARKKTQESIEDVDSEKDIKASPSSPRHYRPSPVARETSIAHSDWSAHSVYAPLELQSQPEHNQHQHHHPKWNTTLPSQQLTPSPHMSTRHGVHTFSHSNISGSPSFEHSTHTSPVSEGLLLNTTAAPTPTYGAYPLSPISGIPSPGSGSTSAPAMVSTMAQQWPQRVSEVGLNPPMHSPWYHMPFEPATPPAGVPHSAPLIPPTTYRDHMPMGAHAPAPGVYSPAFNHYGSEAPEYHPNFWKTAGQYEYTRPEPSRKHLPYQGHGHIVSMQNTQMAPQPIICAPMAPYMG